MHQVPTEDVFGPCSHEFEGHQHFSALMAACMQFMFGKTSLASSLILFLFNLPLSGLFTWARIFKQRTFGISGAGCYMPNANVAFTSQQRLSTGWNRALDPVLTWSASCLSEGTLHPLRRLCHASSVLQLLNTTTLVIKCSAESLLL